jgi:hypothetical protein
LPPDINRARQRLFDSIVEHSDGVLTLHDVVKRYNRDEEFKLKIDAYVLDIATDNTTLH